ncbi:hypothetical protein CEXT_462461 [Caerostris extrusa]|uniref:Uncharacterized protein n=1 Tax=Caerostris extrusa TaxID=172846 RepID=A0AAV4WLU4_CAEEX|nr:hypothetical protein CEXT_462461 [Caerostris extrusa]
MDPVPKWTFPKYFRRAIFSSKHLLSFQLGSLLAGFFQETDVAFSTGEAKCVHLYGNAASPTEHSAAGEISGHANNGITKEKHLCRSDPEEEVKVLPGNGLRFSTGEAKDVHLYGNAAAPTEHSAAGEISGHAKNGVRDVFILKK